ncbi:hypothetical protein [Scytonema sp. PCC 10023]
MITAKILAFAGSARQDSVNKKLVKIAVEGGDFSRRSPVPGRARASQDRS